jgi:apolipoprotein N-acyltransferase
VPAALVSEVPLRTQLTPASRLGPLPEVLLCLAAAAAVVAALVPRRREIRTPAGVATEKAPAVADREHPHSIGD